MIKRELCIALLMALTTAARDRLNWLAAQDPVSLCEIADNPESHKNQIVNIRANLYSYSSGVMQLNGIECGPGSDAWASLEFDSSFLPTSITQQFLDDIGNVRQQGHYKLAEVVLTGRIVDLERACFGPRFILYATQLEQESEIRTGQIQDVMN